MSNINHTIREIHQIDRLANRDQWVNHLHPLVKLLFTFFYIVVLVSFPKYDVMGLLAMAVYPLALFELAELNFGECLWRLRVVLPLVCMVGIANPFLDRTPVALGFWTVNAGVLSMVTLMLKGVFAVLASYLLIATTTIEKICYALRLLHVPAIFVTQFLLTYRYITVLLQEAHRMTQAYALRAPKQRGVHYKAWGSLAGQLLLRSVDRAEEVYESMTLRGYNGEFHYIGEKMRIRWQDIVYGGGWCLIIYLIRKLPVILLIGNFVGGLFV